jgi:hypothetical protein
MTNEQLPHLVVGGFFETEKYTAPPRRGPEFNLPARDRTLHGTSVRDQLQKVRGENEQNRGVQTEPEQPAPISIEVRSEPTDPMRRAFGTKKPDIVNRLRRYGYGVPSLSRALYSARSSLTLIAQQAIQPFEKDGSTKDMGLHDLPWPKEQLLALGEAAVSMRVTLSYFIEPKPGRREGFVKHRHRYQSHGLRFKVRRPGESHDQFQQRVSTASRDEEESYEAVGDTSGWELGPQIMTRGSIHSDWWTGTAADLANSGHIAVHPVSGWWRESKGNHWSKQARYALIVTIRTEETKIDLFTPTVTEVDLYTPVESAIKATIKPTVTTEVEIEGISTGDL